MALGIDISSLFPIIVILAGVVTIQFFYGRKLNLALMRNIIVTLEEVVKPKDQLYTWLGGYIGFKAEYEVDDAVVEKIEATLTLLPRHSILYLPVSKITIKDDRLFIVLRSRFPLKGDVHIIRRGLYRFGKGIDDPMEYLDDRIALNGVEYDVFFKRKEDKDRLIKLISGLPVEKIKHVSVTPSTRVIYAYIVPDRRTIEEVIPRMFRITREFAARG